MGTRFVATDEADVADKVRSLGGLPFLANYVLHFDPKTVALAVEAGAPIVAFSWGDPSPYVAELRNRGVKVGIQAGSVGGIRRFATLEPDFLILQGTEAGGHVQSHTPLFDMIEEAVAAAGAIPLAVAGGIVTGADIARALRCGAQAAVMGTRFVATDEADAHPEYKAALKSAGTDSTAMTICFDGGWPDALHRVLKNPTFEAWEAAGCPLAGGRPGEGDLLGHTASGEMIYRYEDAAPRKGATGRIHEMCLYAGTGACTIQDCPPASALVRRLWDEASADLAATTTS